MASFDTETLHLLGSAQEVTIRTEKHPQAAVPIWVVVAGGDVYVRSVRGEKGRWYQDLKAGSAATLEIQGRRIPIQSMPATHTGSVERASRAFQIKYRGSPYVASILRTEVLPTTLRLEPRP
ncbi:MAG: DUF2255 family protein [Acetobacteraceae bacterium]|nr:DUF2255 family protein [Acetobacteraceae bacterium]